MPQDTFLKLIGVEIKSHMELVNRTGLVDDYCSDKSLRCHYQLFKIMGQKISENIVKMKLEQNIMPLLHNRKHILR